MNLNLEDERDKDILSTFTRRLIGSQKDLDSEFSDIVDENFDELIDSKSKSKIKRKIKKRNKNKKKGRNYE
jgi:hypothetical protein